jgi:hypothetical protein
MMPEFFVPLQRLAPSSAVKPVSISQQVSPILSNPKSALCFLLRCAGCDVVDLRSKGRRKVFVFGDRPKRCDDVLADARLLLAPGAMP